MIGLKTLLTALLFTGTSAALAAQITSASDAALNGASIINFEGITAGEYKNLAIGDVNFSTINNESLYISNNHAGSFNTQGQSLQNTYSSNAFNTLNISFTNTVSAFGFNLGASDEIWTLSAFDINHNLIEAFNILPTNVSNGGDFFGLSGAGIHSAMLSSDNKRDYIFFDNFSSVSAVPEPANYALMLGGLGLIGFITIRQRKQA